ncbi:VUT family protein [Nocardia terpenica]|uniref:hypothetical protein n=1 Tax=Nocardia terpenica TaxID=455432 RepID=UPI002FE24444
MTTGTEPITVSQPPSPATPDVAPLWATVPHPTNDAGPARDPVHGTGPDGRREETADATTGDNGVAPSRRRRSRRLRRDIEPTARGGRFVAWAGFVFGTVFSVVMNWLHTWLPAQHNPPGWSPGVAPQIISAVWPIFLLLAVEVLSRVRWRPGMGWLLARYGGVGTVALGSAVISYGHVYEMLASWDYGTWGAHVGPLVIDGFMVACGFAMLSESTAGTTTPATTTITAGTRHQPQPQAPNGHRVPDIDPTCDTVAPDSGTAAGTRQAPDRAATAPDTVSDADRDDRIRAMYRRVPSTREVGKAFGLHHSTIARIVAEPDSSDNPHDTDRDAEPIAVPAAEERTA